MTPLLDKEEWKEFMEYALRKSTKEELDELENDLNFYLDMIYARQRELKE